MGETTDKIENYMERKREHLGSNLRELEDRVRSATDWQTHFRNHPILAISAAVGGGALIAKLVMPSGARHAAAVRSAVDRPRVHQGEIWSYWNQIKSAAIALAAQRLVGYVDDAVPGFKQQMEKIKPA